MKKKTTETRNVSLTVRMTPSDRNMLEDLSLFLSPASPLSLGKALSVALRMAWSEKMMTVDKTLRAQAKHDGA